MSTAQSPLSEYESFAVDTAGGVRFEGCGSLLRPGTSGIGKRGWIDGERLPLAKEAIS